MEIIRHRFDVIDSTNNWLKARVDDFADDVFVTVSAEEQSAAHRALQL